MKISKLFATAFFAVGVFFSASSNAAEIYYYSDNMAVDKSTYVPEETLLSASLRRNTQYYFEFDEYGTLAAQTRLVYTLTASVEQDKLSPDSSLYFYGSNGSDNAWMSLDKSSDLSKPLSFGALPVLLTASFDNATSSLITKIALTNTTASDQDFDAYFSGYFTALENAVFNGLKLTVTAQTSAVPLPGALLMFGSGMAFLGGIAKRKRTKI